MLLGAHMSTAGGLATAFERGNALACTAIQIFTSSPRQWKGRDLTASEVEAFARAWEGSSCEVCLAHDIYLTRLGTRDPAILEKSRRAFARELTTCQVLGLSLLVFHPVGDADPDEEAVLDRVAASLDDVFAEVPDGGTRVAIETTAGQGADVGWRFEHLARIIERCGSPERLAVCVDTCHVHAAGYDIVSDDGYDTVMAALDAAVGIDRVGAVHLNDSQKPRGSRVDRHTHIGRGTIGEAAFGRILRDPRLADVPKVLETPKDDDMDAVNLALLRRLAGES
ncbi:MAG TPA: deoxyribonuclease IV [Gemmatimonadota bacterium]|nr:deoxyribonuclease IV [Gemmatimonadota bacterium]